MYDYDVGDRVSVLGSVYTGLVIKIDPDSTTIMSDLDGHQRRYDHRYLGKLLTDLK